MTIIIITGIVMITLLLIGIFRKWDSSREKEYRRAWKKYQKKKDTLL